MLEDIVSQHHYGHCCILTSDRAVNQGFLGQDVLAV